MMLDDINFPQLKSISYFKTFQQELQLCFTSSICVTEDLILQPDNPSFIDHIILD